MILGIDASNIVVGGGLTHLREIIEKINIKEFKFKKIIIWGCPDTLVKIRDLDIINKKSIGFFNKNLFLRIFWTIFILPIELYRHNCSILFSPGGMVWFPFKKSITMCQNMQPFELSKNNLYGISLYSLRIYLLNFIFKFSFKRSDGLIFLTNYAKEKVNKSCNLKKINQIIIPHGIDQKFSGSIDDIKVKKLFINPEEMNLLYVSTIEPYKNHSNVIRAAYKLYQEGFKINLILIGSQNKLEGKKFNSLMSKYDAKRKFIRYLGHIDYDEIQNYYLSSSLGIFASSCENMPNILLEMMAAKLPIACSNLGPMPDILKDGGLYFNPFDFNSIYTTVKELINNDKEKQLLAKKAYNYSKEYSWHECSNNTFDYIFNIANKK